MAQKLSKFFTNENEPSEVLELLTRDNKHRNFFTVVKPLDGVKLAFLINGINNGLDIHTMLLDIENNLFSFTIVEFDDVPSSVACDECGGNGTIVCDYCDGDGQIYSHDDNGYDEDCSYCDGGYDSCQTCDGIGEIDDDSTTDYTISTYITFDNEIRENVDLLYLDDAEVDRDSLELNITNPKLIYLGMDKLSGSDKVIDKDYWGNSYINNIDYENNPNTYVRSNSITINRSIERLSTKFRN